MKVGSEVKCRKCQGMGFQIGIMLPMQNTFIRGTNMTHQINKSMSSIRVFSQILEIVKIEQQANQLDQIGIWAWCTLASGKQWPLSKWIRVNTASPYKRAVLLIKKANSSELLDKS